MNGGKFSPCLNSFNREHCIVVGYNSKTDKDLCLLFHNFSKANEQIDGVGNIWRK